MAVSCQNKTDFYIYTNIYTHTQTHNIFLAVYICIASVKRLITSSLSMPFEKEVVSEGTLHARALMRFLFSPSALISGCQKSFFELAFNLVMRGF